MRKLYFLALCLGLFSFLAPVPEGAAQKNDLRLLMREKMKSSERLLEGIALADFTRITNSAEKLIQLSNTAEWFVRKTPRYELHSNEFRRAAEVIVQKAKAKNLDGVALAYFDLTLSCVRCHQYVREVQDARLPDTPALETALASSNRDEGRR
jgi:hypothetical protein